MAFRVHALGVNAHRPPETGALPFAALDVGRQRAAGVALEIRPYGVTGKTVAGDLMRRKWSFPVVWALAQPASPAREVVAGAYRSRRSLDATEVANVVAALEELGARESAMRAVAEPMAVVERHPNRALRDYLLETLAEPVG